jgi:hypothetical protein
MIAFIRKLWHRHKVKSAEHRAYRDQGYSPGHGIDEADPMIARNRHEGGHY